MRKASRNGEAQTPSFVPKIRTVTLEDSAGRRIKLMLWSQFCHVEAVAEPEGMGWSTVAMTTPRFLESLYIMCII